MTIEALGLLVAGVAFAVVAGLVALRAVARW